MVLNDAHGRQAVNQFMELLSGRFGLDMFRLLAPCRFFVGNYRDLKHLKHFDKVFVQTKAEANYLKNRFVKLARKISIYSNAGATLRLFGAQRVARPALLPRVHSCLLYTSDAADE